MKAVSQSVLKTMTAKEISGLAPFALTSEGVPIAVVVKPEDVVVIADLHPAVKKQFRAKERMVRVGMTGRPIMPVSLSEIRAEVNPVQES